MKFLLLPLVAIAFSASVSRGADFITEPPYFGARYTSATTARGLLLDEAGDILVVNHAGQASGAEAVFDELNADGTVNVCRVRIVDGTGLLLNHGIAYNRGYLYLSSATVVYRWPYTPGQRSLITAPAETVINGIPGPSGHPTRTLIFDSENGLYVAIGSNANVDPNSDRARIRRFVLDGATFPLDFGTGEVFADGVRNEVGIDFDRGGTLWGVENGADELNRPDLGGDIHNGNPAEELNRFGAAVGTHYGYPYCFSTDDLSGVDALTQFAWPSFMNDGVHDDAWCRNPANNKVPELALPAHSAPLGIEFYKGQNCGVPGTGAFPCNATADAFIAFHGAWNTDFKVGYDVRRYFFDKLMLSPTGGWEHVLTTPNTSNCSGGNCFRPVNAIFDSEGHLVVSADASSELVKIYYGREPPTYIEGCRAGSKYNNSTSM